MSSDATPPPATAHPTVGRLELARAFAAGQLTGDQFEDQYLEAFHRHADSLDDLLADVLNEIFFLVDAYLSNDLRQHHGAVLRGDQIDEPELRRRVQVLLDRLDQQDPAG